MEEGQENLPRSFDLPEEKPTAIAGKVLTAPKPRRGFLKKALYGLALLAAPFVGGKIGEVVEPVVGPLIDKDLGMYKKPAPNATETPIADPNLPNAR